MWAGWTGCRGSRPAAPSGAGRRLMERPPPVFQRRGFGSGDRPRKGYHEVPGQARDGCAREDPRKISCMPGLFTAPASCSRISPPVSLRRSASMTYAPNSPEARDIAYHFHSYTNAALHAETGPVIIGGGRGHLREGQSRQALYRGDGGAVECRGGLWRGAAYRGGCGSDAQAALLPQLHPPRAPGRDRPCRKAGADGAGAHVEKCSIPIPGPRRMTRSSR
jgi:hypothetical protein